MVPPGVVPPLIFAERMVRPRLFPLVRAGRTGSMLHRRGAKPVPPPWRSRAEGVVAGGTGASSPAGSAALRRRCASTDLCMLRGLLVSSSRRLERLGRRAVVAGVASSQRAATASRCLWKTGVSDPPSSIAAATTPERKKKPTRMGSAMGSALIDVGRGGLCSARPPALQQSSHISAAIAGALPRRRRGMLPRRPATTSRRGSASRQVRPRHGPVKAPAFNRRPLTLVMVSARAPAPPDVVAHPRPAATPPSGCDIAAASCRRVITSALMRWPGADEGVLILRWTVVDVSHRGLFGDRR